MNTRMYISGSMVNQAAHAFVKTKEVDPGSLEFRSISSFGGGSGYLIQLYKAGFK